MSQKPAPKPAAHRQSITAKLAAEKAAQKIDGASQLEMLLFAAGLVGMLFVVLALGGRASSCHFGYSLATDRDLLRLTGSFGSYWSEGVDWMVGSGGLRNAGGFYYMLIAPVLSAWPGACTLYIWQLVLALASVLVLFAMLRGLYGQLAALVGAAAFIGSTAFLALSLDALWLGFLPLFVVGAVYLMMKGAAANTPYEIKWATGLIALAMMIDPGAWVLLALLFALPVFVPGWRRLRAWVAALGLLIVLYSPWLIGLFIPNANSFGLFNDRSWADRIAGLALTVEPRLIANGVVTLIPGLKPALVTGQGWFWLVLALGLPALLSAMIGFGLTLLGYRRHRRNAKAQDVDSSVTGFDPVLAVAGLAVVAGLLLPALRFGPASRLPLIEPGWLMAAIGLAVLIAGSIGHLFSPQRLKAPLRIAAVIILLLGMLLPATQLGSARAVGAQQIGLDYGRVEAALQAVAAPSDPGSATRAIGSMSVAAQGHWTCFDRPVTDWCVEPVHGWTVAKPERAPSGFVYAPCVLLVMDPAAARVPPQLDAAGLSAMLGQQVSPLGPPVAFGPDQLVYFSPAQGGCPTAFDNRALIHKDMAIDAALQARLLSTEPVIQMTTEAPFEFAFALPQGGSCWPGSDNRPAAAVACPPITGRVRIDYAEDGQLRAMLDSRDLRGSGWRASSGPIAMLRAPTIRFVQQFGSRSYDLTLTDGLLGYRGAGLPVQGLTSSVPSGAYRVQLIGFRSEGLRPGMPGQIQVDKPFVVELTPGISLAPRK